MANELQVKGLLAGVEGWNQWRNKNPYIKIDLRKASLKDANLEKVNLGRADLREADLSGAILYDADLREANLNGANLRGANCNGVNLYGSDLGGANFRVARLAEADLSYANLHGADLNGAYILSTNFNGAKLIGVDLSASELAGAILKKAYFSSTILGNVDLSETKGLEELTHLGPSMISTSTLERSKGKIPVKFLRGCGMSDWEIESSKLYQLGLSAKEVNDIVYRIYDLRANRAIQINGLFISYTHKDRSFVDQIEKQLNDKSIRFWRDIHDAPAGPLEEIVDQAIQKNPIFLLVLSKRSVKSDWVQHETRKARELELKLHRHVLCPVALDSSWKTCDWPERLKEQIMEYNILDFSKWKDAEEFGKKFRKLIDGLDLFYKEK